MIRFKYNGHQVEITGEEKDAVTIEVDGEDFTPFWDGREPAEVWIKRHLNTQAQQSGIRASNAVAKNQGKDPDIAALEARIGITLDELKHLPESVRTNVDKLIAEKLKASYAADEAKTIAEVKAAEADRAIMQARAAMAEEELASMLRPENLPALVKSFKEFQTRNRLAKAVHIVCACIFCLLADSLFYLIGWNWAPWIVNIVAGIYAAGTLFYRGTVPLSRADWGKYGGPGRR
jgi:hypothetical protein